MCCLLTVVSFEVSSVGSRFELSSVNDHFELSSVNNHLLLQTAQQTPTPQ